MNDRFSGPGNNNSGDNKDNNNGNNRRQPFMVFIVLALIAMFLTSLFYSGAGSNTSQAITYSEFLNLVEKDQVEKVVFDGDQINIKLIKDTTYKGKDEANIILLISETMEPDLLICCWNTMSRLMERFLILHL